MKYNIWFCSYRQTTGRSLSLRRLMSSAMLIAGIATFIMAGSVYAADKPSENLGKESREVDKSQKATVNKSASGKYPPYPEVWGQQFPMSDRFGKDIQISVQEANDGDLSVIYLSDNYMSKGNYFFSGRKIDEKKAEKYRKRSQLAGNSMGRSEIKIDDDTSWEQGQACFRCCPEYSKFPITKYAPTRTGQQLSVIYVSEKPIRRRNVVPEQCVGKGAWQKPEGEYFEQQVFETIPFFVPLKDATFLLYDSHGNFLIRLDKNFNSKSKLLNRNVFVVETTDIKAIEAKLSEEDMLGLQTYNDSVLAYLNAIKAGLHRDKALNEAINLINQVKEKTRGR